MTILVACLGAGKGTWVDVLKLTKAAQWDKIILVTTPYFVDKLPKIDGVQTKVVVADDTKPVQEMEAQMSKQLELSFAGEVAVNMISGGGKEHMALIGALLKCGCGIRFVVASENGLEEV